MNGTPVPKSHPGLPALVMGVGEFAHLPAEEAEVLRRNLLEVRLKPGEQMSSRTIGFVLTGLLRAYYVDRGGKDRTKAFWSAGKLVYSLGATAEHPGRASDETLADWTVEAIEPTQIFTLSLEALDRLYGGHSCWNHIGRVFWQQAYREKLVREREFLLLSATERYQEFTRAYPELGPRIPQYVIASYLGITPVALSRLRGRKVKRR